MKDIFYEFEIYCTNPNISSGKAFSYAKAIKYLCEFLELDITSKNLKKEIANIEPYISDKNSSLYLNLLSFLTNRKQSSYLKKNFIKAAIPLFISFLSEKENSIQSMTKVDAIKEVIKECNGHATWDDIYRKSSNYYPNIANSVQWKAGLRGVLYRELKNNRTFKRNLDGSFSLVEDSSVYNFITKNNEETEIFDSLKNYKIDVSFDINKTLGIIPTKEAYEHQYYVLKTSGTSMNSIYKVYSGRKAEKYFLDFLKTNQFILDRDYFDVANKKSEGFDVKFFNMGLEIKNIKSGSFYLSDNEIAHIENQKTHLILIDIDNGIWLLKNTSAWLKNIIAYIKEIRSYCKSKYYNLDLTDIKINIDKKIETELFEISQLPHNDIYNLLTQNKS